MMSSWFAQKADVEHAIDTRYPTLFEGVGGLAKTQGEILCKSVISDIKYFHSFQMSFNEQLEVTGSLEIGSFQFDVSMHVMDSDYDVMIGLDFIRRHKCRIDFTEKRWQFMVVQYRNCLEFDRNRHCRLIVDNNAHIKMLSCSEIDEYFASREGERMCILSVYGLLGLLAIF